VVEGRKNQEDMIDLMLGNNKVQSYVLRVLAFVVMVVGIYAFFSPIV